LTSVFSSRPKQTLREQPTSVNCEMWEAKALSLCLRSIHPLNAGMGAPGWHPRTWPKKRAKPTKAFISNENK
jgi:hypothetical protein